MECLEREAHNGSRIWAVVELAEELDRSPRQILTAVRSLESRGLVRTQHGVIRWIESELGFSALERPVPGILVGEREHVDAEEKRIRDLLRAAGAL